MKNVVTETVVLGLHHRQAAWEQLSLPINKLPWDTAKVVGIKGGGGPKVADPGGGPKGADPAGTDLPSGPNVIGTCFEGTDLASFFSGAPAPAFAAAFSRSFLKYSLAALIFLR